MATLAYKTITASNAVITLVIPGLYDAPQIIQQFSADDVFSADAVQAAEVQMGVDGRLSAGFIYTPKPWNISLMADSDSNDIFENWNNSMQVAQDIFYANGNVLLTSIRRSYTLTKGALTTFPPMVSAGKVLQPRRYTIVWESILPEVVA